MPRLFLFPHYIQMNLRPKTDSWWFMEFNDGQITECVAKVIANKLAQLAMLLSLANISIDR